MRVEKHIFVIVVLMGVCTLLIGCESTVHNIEKADTWIRSNLW